MRAIVRMMCMVWLVAASPPLNPSVATDAEPKKAGPESQVVSDTLPVKPSSTHQLIVYYFHGTQRCSNCIKIEAYTKEVVDSGFATQVKDSTIVWRVINTDEESNKHFRDEYQLFTKSVVLSELADGKQVRWKNLDKIWEVLGDKTTFQTYVRNEVSALLESR